MYWWAGREVAYTVGGVCMSLLTAVAWRGLVEPQSPTKPETEAKKEK